MAADPIPVDGVAFLDPDGAIAETDAHRADWIGRMDALEPKAWVVGIVAEESVGVARALLHLIRELGERPPEPACESRFHSRFGSSFSVRPSRASSSASSANSFSRSADA